MVVAEWSWNQRQLVAYTATHRGLVSCGQAPTRLENPDALFPESSSGNRDSERELTPEFGSVDPSRARARARARAQTIQLSDRFRAPTPTKNRRLKPEDRARARAPCASRSGLGLVSTHAISGVSAASGSAWSRAPSTAGLLARRDPRPRRHRRRWFDGRRFRLWPERLLVLAAHRVREPARDRVLLVLGEAADVDAGGIDRACAEEAFTDVGWKSPLRAGGWRCANILGCRYGRDCMD